MFLIGNRLKSPRHLTRCKYRMLQKQSIFRDMASRKEDALIVLPLVACGIAAGIVLYIPDCKSLQPVESTFDDVGLKIVEPEDGGAILVDSVTRNDGHYKAMLRLKPEGGEASDNSPLNLMQWFNFEAQGLPVGPGTKASFTILNCGSSMFNDWSGYQVCYSRDRVQWHRASTTNFNPSNGSLQWTLENNTSSMVYFSYYPPYSLEKQSNLIARAQATGKCRHHVLGKSADGRYLTCLVFGSSSQENSMNSPRKIKVWIQHRQHPGEVAASWFCEGVVDRLLELSGTDVKNENGEADAQSNLLDHAVVYVVPNMNPDGGVRGHHCTNAAGQNLNECWGGLNGVGSWKRKAPETEAAMKAMQSIGGPDILLDIHQDETRPYVFASKSSLGVAACTPESRLWYTKFTQTLRALSKDFETPGSVDCVGYPEPSQGAANLSACSPAVAQAWPGCLAVTVEMPFKRNINAGSGVEADFMPEQCRALGAACIDTLSKLTPEFAAGARKRVR